MRQKLFKKQFILFAVCFCCVQALFVAGCSRPQGRLFPESSQALVWPSPPEKGRIKYVGSLSTEDDLKKAVSWSLGELLFGKKEKGVLTAPYALAVAQGGKLFVTDISAGSVHIFNLDTRDYKQFSYIAKDKCLQSPVALTVIDADVYVVDSILHEVFVFNNKGKFMFSFGGESLKRPSGIAYSRKDAKIYVADAAEHVINVFSREGNLIRQIGQRGFKAGQFNFPTHLCVDNTGQLYVSDTLNYRVQVLTSEGKFLRMFGEHGDRPGNFAHPAGIAADAFGHIYVVDRQFENMQIFNSKGQILMALGGEGNRAGEFWLPGGIVIDGKNRVYIADSFNKRVQIFELLEEGYER